MPSCTQTVFAPIASDVVDDRRDVAALAEHVDDVGHDGQVGERLVDLLAEDLVGVRVDEVQLVVARLLQVGGDEVARARRVRRGADDRDRLRLAQDRRGAPWRSARPRCAATCSSFASGESAGMSQVRPFVQRDGLDDPELRSRRSCPDYPFTAAVERLVEVVDDVVEVLDADADAHQARAARRASSSCCSVSWAWVVEAGWMTSVFASPMLARWLARFDALDEALPDRARSPAPSPSPRS